MCSLYCVHAQCPGSLVISQQQWLGLDFDVCWFRVDFRLHKLLNCYHRLYFQLFLWFYYFVSAFVEPDPKKHGFPKCLTKTSMDLWSKRCHSWLSFIRKLLQAIRVEAHNLTDYYLSFAIDVTTNRLWREIYRKWPWHFNFSLKCLGKNASSFWMFQ